MATASETAVAAGARRRGFAHGGLWRAAARWLRLLGGLWVFAGGLALMVRADLGLSSWDVLHDALARGPLTFGQSVVAVSLAVVGGSFLLGIKPGPATVANMILVGAFTDVLLGAGLLDGLSAASVPARAIAFGAGVAAIAFGTALYIGANLGAGPRDSLMLAASRRLRTTAGSARTIVEAAVLVAGILLGGRAGAGTVAFALLIGPAIDVSFAALGMDSGEARRRGPVRRLGAALYRWGRRGRLGADASTEMARYTGALR